MRAKRAKAGWAAYVVVVAGCSDSMALEEARFPIVEGIYNVETRTVSNSCSRLGALDGSRIYVFFQEPGGELELRPPRFRPEGVVLSDVGIEGHIQPDGDFTITGAYPIRVEGQRAVVGYTLEGRFEGDHLEAEERQLAAFLGTSCEIVFSVVGEEV